MNNSKQLENIATRLLLGKRKTRRSKNKKPTKSAKWQHEFKQAMINQQILKSQYKELAQQKKDYVRLIGELYDTQTTIPKRVQHQLPSSSG